MSAALWVLAGWVVFSLLLALAFALGAGIGYRRGQEDAREAGMHTIRVDDQAQVEGRQHAPTRAS